jgi:hypothetical protein
MTSAIGHILQNARDFDPKRVMTDDVRGATDRLFDELERARVDYLLVGGVALLSYVEGRNTQDVDLLISPDAAHALPWNATIADRDFGRATFDGVQVDLLLTTNPLFAEVHRTERTKRRFGSRDVACATRSGLLLLKLYALPSLYRQGNLARAALYETDIAMLHQGEVIDDDALLVRLKPHVATHDLSELRHILDEQRSRRRDFR